MKLLEKGGLCSFSYPLPLRTRGEMEGGKREGEREGGMEGRMEGGKREGEKEGGMEGGFPYSVPSGGV